MTIWMVEQLGLAMMLRSRKPASASRLTSGTTSGTSSSMRNCEVLSITTQPASAARGAWILETAAPGENRPRSKPSKSKSSSGRTVRISSSPKLTSLPAEARDASATTSSTGNLRSARMLSISPPDRAGRADHRHSIAHVPRSRLRGIGDTLAVAAPASREKRAGGLAPSSFSSDTRHAMTVTISADQARRLVLSLQGLADPPRRRLPTAGVLDLIERLGFLQLDSISTVARAHHMILFARNQTYRPAALKRLHEDERALFEHWTHRIASLLPVRFYPYWRLRFAREQAMIEARFRRWFGDGFALELERLLERVRAEGAIRARDLEAERARPAGGWWDWHAGKTALEYLWRTGRLAIAQARRLPEGLRSPRAGDPGGGARAPAERGGADRLGLPGGARAPRLCQPERDRGLLRPDHDRGGEELVRPSSWRRRGAGAGRSGERRRAAPARSRVPTSRRCCDRCRTRPPGCARSIRSTRCCATGRASPGCSLSTTGSRCSSRRRAGSTATMSFRYWRATGWSGGST